MLQIPSGRSSPSEGEMHLRNTRTVLATKQQDWTTNRIHTHVWSGCWLLSGHFGKEK